MFTISFEFDSNLASLDVRLRAAIANKLVELTEQLYKKVEENVSGKILNRKSGALAAKIAEGVEIDTTLEQMYGFVGPANPGPKEWALEIGGKGYYSFGPTKANVLSWLGKDGGRVFAKSVNHPPSKAFHYLKEAADEMEPIIPEGFHEAIQRVLSGGV